MSYIKRARINEEKHTTISRFLSGLKLEIRNKVELLPYRDLTDLIQLSIKVEKQILRKQSSRKQSSYYVSYDKDEFHRGEEHIKETSLELSQNLSKHISHTQARKFPCFTYLGNDQLASQCPNERSMILRDKDKNSNQEKETSETDENVKIENQEKTLGKQKAWEKSVPSHKVIQQEGKVENTFENMFLIEQPQSLTFCKGTHARLLVDYFDYVKVKLSIGIYKDNFLREVVPKETCHVLLRQPLQNVKISVINGRINETTVTYKREIFREGELMGQIRVDKTLELLKGKFFWSPMRKDVQRHYPRYISCFKNTSKAMFHELYTP